MTEPTLKEVQEAILNMGLPTDTPQRLAEQLLKRAHQLAKKRQHSVRQTLDYLLELLRQGWAAKQSGKRDQS